VKCLGQKGGPGNIVSMASGYGLNDPGIESRWRQDFPHLSRLALEPPSHLNNEYRVFPGVKERPGHADPSPPSNVLVEKEQSYNSTPPMGCTTRTKPQCLYKSGLYLYFT
jgi:hypothetical protein